MDKESEKAEQGVQRVSFFVVPPEFAPWDIIPLEKLVVSHAIKKIHACRGTGTRRFVIVFT